jgi:hypothetical protein
VEQEGLEEYFLGLVGRSAIGIPEVPDVESGIGEQPGNVGEQDARQANVWTEWPGSSSSNLR